ncbi:DUF4186 domain-containing protein [Acetobacter pasteurianus]|uniref:DUF4186 domain-containing protein n=1 Tax=Acetobacter pasteurianus NBRC 3188 TaxID=1226663 RepID=A0A401WX50_ACEPA|nr:DUF4186 domain-containing protein [Acetobacter pasteurianus]GCD53855.1 hypothetical protein NBRC3188_2552 [Acetobacter pasteurianus NBRC 3188]
MQQGDLFPQEQTLPPVSDTLWARLTRSSFRSRFHLNCQDMTYLTEKGLPVVMEHGRDFISRRLAPANPKKDGKQTPWKGHPVFVAQHATGTCCRSCLEKWHGFVKHQPLSLAQQAYVLAVIIGWLERELERENKKGSP